MPPALLHNTSAIMALVSNSVYELQLTLPRSPLFFFFTSRCRGKGNDTFFYCEPESQAGGSKAGFRSRGIRDLFGVQTGFGPLWWNDQRVIRRYHWTEKKQLELLSVSRAGLKLLARSACNLSSLGGANEGDEKGRTPVWVAYTLVLTEHSCFSFTPGLLR